MFPYALVFVLQFSTKVCLAYKKPTPLHTPCVRLGFKVEDHGCYWKRTTNSNWRKFFHTNETLKLYEVFKTNPVKEQLFGDFINQTANDKKLWSATWTKEFPRKAIHLYSFPIHVYVLPSLTCKSRFFFSYFCRQSQRSVAHPNQQRKSFLHLLNILTPKLYVLASKFSLKCTFRHPCCICVTIILIILLWSFL